MARPFIPPQPLVRARLSPTSHRATRKSEKLENQAQRTGYARVDVEAEIIWVPRTRLASVRLTGVRLTGGSSLARTGQARPGYLRPKIKGRTGRRRMNRTTPRMTIERTRS